MKSKNLVFVLCIIILLFLNILKTDAQKATDAFHNRTSEDQEKILLYEEKEKEKAQKILSPFVKKDKQIDYYKETGMYAFDMVPDHWYDPANKEDLREQSIFLGIAIIFLLILLKFWKIR